MKSKGDHSTQVLTASCVLVL